MKYLVTVSGRPVEVEVDGETVRVDGRTMEAHLSEIARTPLRHLVLDGASSVLALAPAGRGKWHALAGGEAHEVEVLDERTRHIRSLVGAGREHARGGVLKAPMPGLVLRVLVEPGREVQAGEGVVVLEAMKMENELKAATGGVVARVLVEPGQAVEKGAVLVECEAPEPT